MDVREDKVNLAQPCGPNQMAQQSTSKHADFKQISAETNFRDTVAVDGFSNLRMVKIQGHSSSAGASVPMHANRDTDSRSLIGTSGPVCWSVPQCRQHSIGNYFVVSFFAVFTVREQLMLQWMANLSVYDKWGGR
mmetsp:Transcript_54053/g.112974  ORF Transcript_54053/g.112974 Transcript_54053/m.112974 type:complete len:135 (+) Transcript_54053:2397-2801(+)